MAASAKPHGEVPSRFGATDVKPAPSPEPEIEIAFKETDNEVAQEGAKSVSIQEDDLKEIEQLKSIPYARFKEVNEKAKSLESQLKDFDKKYQDDLRRAVEDAELRVTARLEDQKQDTELDNLDPYERSDKRLEKEMASLRSELSDIKAKNSHQRLQAELDRLEKKYPKADTLAVLGWAKSQPQVDIEELMEKSHSRNVDYVEKEIRAILEQKKLKAKTAIPTRESGIKIKDTDRPHTVKEANSLLRRLLNNE